MKPAVEPIDTSGHYYCSTCGKTAIYEVATDDGSDTLRCTGCAEAYCAQHEIEMPAWGRA